MADRKRKQDEQAASAADSFFYMPEDETGPGTHQRNLPRAREDAKPAETPLDPDLASRMIEHRVERMVAVQEARAEEVKADFRPYEELHEAGREVQSQLVSLRRFFRGHYGVENANRILATEGPIARTSQAILLRRQGALVVEQLRKVDLEPPERLPGGCEVNVFVLAHDLNMAVSWLEQAQTDVERQRHKLHSILEKKARYRRELDAEYREVVRFAARLCRLAGHPEIALEIEAECLEGLSS